MIVEHSSETSLKPNSQNSRKHLPTKDAEAIVMHQDAFAADFQLSELFLLGAAIKYAGVHGKELRIIGTTA
jgi:hypothetical protein